MAAPLLLLLLSLLATCCSSSSPGTDAMVLTSLKQGFSPPTPSALDNWDVSNPSSVCSWHGVQCDDGRVASLDLSHLNISGVVATQFSGLDRLATLSLAGNSLRGEILLSGLPALRHLNISGNQLDGNLDWDYSTLPALETFDAYDNNFTARLPAYLAASRSLRYLDLGGNFFFGHIPPSYGTFPSLEYLSVAGNDLRGRIPPEIGNLTTIRELYLGYYNVFSGGIPTSVATLPDLHHLDLSSCNLAGEIPPDLGRLRSLRTLFLHTNLLAGAIPPSLGNLTSLTSLDLSNNALMGTVPPELSSLRALTLLNLFMNKLHGPVPSFVAALPELDTLGLFMNNFTGAIPQELGSNGKLRVLDLSSNKLTGTIPDKLCFSNQLRVLILLKNFLFGPIPEGLGRCSALTRVRLGQNYLNGSLPRGLLYLPELNLLELQSNYLTGPLLERPADSPTTSSELEQVNLSNNLLSGPIPSSIANLSSLQTLLLGCNRLDGAIPAGIIAALTSLVKLDLSSNAISGTIPPEVGTLSQLTYLDLSRNNLGGPIPAELAAIPILNYLNLSHNHLNQSIPRPIAVMKSLTAADFSFNDLEGRLPDTGQFAYLNASAFAGNPRLCGAVLNNPCNPASSSSLADPSPHSRRYPGDYRLVLALALLVLSLSFAAAAIACRARWPYADHDPAEWKLTTFRRVDFAVSDVLDAMKDANIIGRGGAGVVYIGHLPSGEAIAVKRLLGLGCGGGGHEDHGFRAEVRTLGSIRHRNIVRLLAFCTNAEANVLVYEYMRNGSLGDVLHGKGGGFLTWGHRYRIAVEAARGLCYLHHDCTPMIVHRDVKSSNILLDDKLEAHVADFGLAKFLRGGGGGASECMSAIAGSYGYIAPEYAYTLKVDEKSDVYSYGVVLLELLTGRKPVGGFGEGIDIVQWARTTTSSRREHVARVVDSRLGTDVPADEAAHVFFVAMLCVQENSVERPTMREVVQVLSEHPRHLRADHSPSSSEAECRLASPDKDSSTCYKLFN